MLILAGEADFFTNWERLEYVQGLFPNCELHPLIEGAGSFMPFEKPEAHANAIIEFLKR
jgi:pimeloyl-ACP methyl ester carboxylesterase